MSLTITNPKNLGVTTWLPSCNDITYRIASTESTQNGFYFLVEVYINNAKVVTLRKYPVTGLPTELNIKDIVNAYISSVFSVTNAVGTNWHTGSDFVKFHIQATEWYGGESYDSVTSIDMYAFDASAPFEILKTTGQQTFYRNFTYDTYYNRKGRPMGYHQALNINPDDLFDTLQKPYILYEWVKEYTYPLVRGDKRDLSMFCGENISRNTEITCLIAYGFDEYGEYIKKAVKTIATANDNVNRHWTNYIVTGGTETNWTMALNGALETVTDLSDCKYIYYCFAKSYEANLRVESDASQGVLFEICDCEESYSVLYKSYEGGWRNIQCNRRVTEQTNINTITRKNVSPYLYTANTRLTTAVYVEANGTLVLHTPWLNEALNEEVQDMLRSPLIYIQHFKDGSIEYIPVTLTDANYTTEEKNSVNLFSYTLTFTESYSKNTIIN